MDKYYKIGVTGGLLTSKKKLCGYFDTEEEARYSYREICKQREVLRKESEIVANEVLESIEKKLIGFMSENSCDISYTLEGDTQGIYNDYMYIGVYVNGFYFTKKIKQ